MRLDIEIGIIITLLNKGQTTYRELSAKFDVSTRTICRYVSVLDTAGIPITTKTGRNGGVRILNTFRLNNMFFSVQEKMALITACSHINNVNMRKAIQDKLLSI